ncbi:MAG: 2,3-dimethylmalate dehydratase small subunit [Firmicutes bacterium ADurb.Bin456]|nr:MAG: 2,3-dimethylmalate dehydratase small subunit [Firmicutes bacterium ADurb.Bin456]
MHFNGKAHKFGDDVNTDYIISGKYKFKTLDMKELAKYVMEDLEPNFYKKVTPGDFIVAGSNFGCGSSREQAPLAIKYAGVGAVLANSFARIFFRNAINTGLPVVECDTSGIDPGDELSVDLESGVINNRSKGTVIPVKPLPEVMIKILKDGGLAPHFRKHGGFNLE